MTRDFGLTSPSAIIVGAGLIGLAVARAVSAKGWRAHVYERDAVGARASTAAAGMLAPFSEAVGSPATHPDLMALGRASLQLWPSWAAGLTAETGVDLNLRRDGSLIVAFDGDAQRRFESAAMDIAAAGGDAEVLSGAAAREREPGLSGDITAALALGQDVQADNRAAIEALTAWACGAGVNIERGVDVVEVRPGPRPAVRLDESGRACWRGADAVIVCAGWRSAALKGLAGLEAICPVKGQALAVSWDGRLRHTVRAPGAYVVPKLGGRIVVGATDEPGRADCDVEDSAIDRLRAAAARAVPGLADTTVVERWAGVRPGSRDHAPLIGAVGPGVYLAAGHHRNGVLLTPVTASAIADMVADGVVPDLVARFAPGRFIQAGDGAPHRA